MIAGLVQPPTRSGTDVGAPFLMDSNAWIRPWDRYYPVAVFARLWEDLAKAVHRGHLLVPEQIGVELTEKASGLGC